MDKPKTADTSLAREAAVRATVKEMEKRYGAGALMQLSAAAQHVPVIPTGSLALDRAIGCGGYPRGRIVEVYGPESAGKTTLTLHAIAEAQRAGGTAAFIDAEHAFDPAYAQALGVKLEDLWLAQPDYGEQALEIADGLVCSGGVDLIVVDSVAALVPKAEIDGEMGDQLPGLQARLMSQAMRKLTAVCHKHDATIIFINQIRMKIGVMYGSPETTPGGNALKFYASLRLDVRRRGALKTGEEQIGNLTEITVKKNKMAPPFKSAEVQIHFGKGIDRCDDLLTVATETGVLEKSGSWFLFLGEKLGNGRDAVTKLLAATPTLFATIEAAVRARVAQG